MHQQFVENIAETHPEIFVLIAFIDDEDFYIQEECKKRLIHICDKVGIRGMEQQDIYDMVRTYRDMWRDRVEN